MDGYEQSGGAPHALIVSLVRRLLREAFEGPPGPWTYFSDVGPGTGLLGTLGGLSGAQASGAGGPGGTTVAGHAYHVAASLAQASAALHGEPTTRDRGHSWAVSALDDAAWAELRAQLRREYDRMVVAVETHAFWDEDALGAALGAMAHAAYHLGAIRQRLPPLEAARPQH